MSGGGGIVTENFEKIFATGKIKYDIIRED